MPDVSIPLPDGASFSAYSALPPSGTGPALIVIQEIFGVNANMRKTCDIFAAQGYVTLCPDLFWRQEPGVQLTDQTPEEWERAFAFYKGFDVDAGLQDLRATLAFARHLPACSGKAGVVGYCLGGKLAFLMAARSDSDASVGYYGVGLETYLTEGDAITKPLLLHIAGLDSYVPPPIRAEILGATAKNAQISAYVYDEADHAFARWNGQNYNKEAAERAQSRTLAFLDTHLKEQEA